MKSIYYLIAPSRFGEYAIIWHLTHDQPRILRLVLPGIFKDPLSSIHRAFLGAVESTHPDLVSLTGDIGRYLGGASFHFDLRCLDWDACTAFQIRVLLAEYEIPRGWVSTYGRIARKLGIPGGSRAVGNALAANPFPLLIPCHRAVRSTGKLGGYQGGLAMKKTLLEMEGVVFSSADSVSLEKIYY